MGEWMYRSMFSWPRHYLELSGQLHATDALSPGEMAPGTRWIRRWVNPRTGLDDVEKRKISPLFGIELRSLGRSARRPSLQWICFLIFKVKVGSSRTWMIYQATRCHITEGSYLDTTVCINETLVYIRFFPRNSAQKWDRIFAKCSRKEQNCLSSKWGENWFRGMLAARQFRIFVFPSAV
jgi:hypothetical protein